MTANENTNNKFRLKEVSKLKKWIVYITFFSIYFLITFFGLGPVLFADGSNNERLITTLIIIVLYILTTLGFRKLLIKHKVNR